MSNESSEYGSGPYQVLVSDFQQSVEVLSSRILLQEPRIHDVHPTDNAMEGMECMRRTENLRNGHCMSEQNPAMAV